MSCCPRCDEHIPPGAVILARQTTECCVVYVVDGVVTKLLKDSVRPDQIRKRCEVAAEHPDLFAAMAYDEVAHAIRQPYIAEPAAIGVREMFAELKRRHLEGVRDVSLDNIRGLVLVDFAVGANPAATRRWLRARRANATKTA